MEPSPVFVVVDDFLSPDECAALLKKANAQPWHQAMVNVGDGMEELDLEERRHTRTYIDDESFAALVSERVGTRTPHDFVNPRFRVLKYAPFEYFKPHYDGEQCHLGGVSTHTLLVYLCDMPDTGATHFCDTGVRVYPKMGRALIFRQDDTLHEGEPPSHGIKIVARTDLMVRCP
jgi:hypothetical protein